MHPLASAGEFESTKVDSRSQSRTRICSLPTTPTASHATGRELTLVSVHRPLQAYTDALTEAGFVIERLREVGRPDHAITHERSRRWQRLPLFLHLRAVKR